MTLTSKRVLVDELKTDSALISESLSVLLLAPRIFVDPAEEDQFRRFSDCLPSSDLFAGKTATYPGQPARPTGLLRSIAARMAAIRTLMTAIPRHDIIHVFHFSGRPFLLHAAPAIVLARFFGKKVVLSYSDSMGELDLERSHEIYRPFFRLCDTIAVSSHYLRTVLSGYRFDSEVMPGGIADSTSSANRATQLQPRILMVRSLERQAGYVAAIRAFKLVKQKYPRAEMVIVGDGTRREFLRELIKRENIHGINLKTSIRRPEFGDLLNWADLYLSASIHDTIPAAIWRVLSAGMPIVACDTGGVGEVIRERQNGLLVRVNDFSGMADRIIELIEAPELVSSLSAAALATADRYRASSVCKAWRTLYGELC